MASVASNQYSHGQELFYKFISNFANKLVKQLLSMTVHYLSAFLFMTGHKRLEDNFDLHPYCFVLPLLFSVFPLLWHRWYSTSTSTYCNYEGLEYFPKTVTREKVSNRKMLDIFLFDIFFFSIDKWSYCSALIYNNLGHCKAGPRQK